MSTEHVRLPLEPPATEMPGTRSTTLLRTAAMVGAGLAAAALGTAVIAGIGEVFQLPPELAGLGIGQIPGAEDQRRLTAANDALNYKHSALWVGSASAIMGVVFGAVLGLFRRSRRAAAVSAIACAIGGGVFGTAAGVLGIYLDQSHRAGLSTDQLVVSDPQVMLMHGLLWLTVGIGCGLGIGLSSPSRNAHSVLLTVVLTLMAGLLGGALYPLVAGLAMPLADPSLPIPLESAERFLWLSLPAVLMGAVLGRKG